MTESAFWFRSSRFDIEAGEDDETNPGRFGRQLALWLRERLASAGYETEPVIAEDWGRCIMCQREPFRLWIGVGNAELPEPEAASTADAMIWHCFVVAEVPLLKRLFGSVDSAASVSALAATLHRVFMEEPGIDLIEEP